MNFIEIESSSNALEEVAIYSVNGQEVYREKMPNSKLQIDLRSAPSGVYFVQVLGESGIQLDRKQIIVQ